MRGKKTRSNAPDAAVSAPVPTGSRRQERQRPATEKQIAFVRRLLAASSSMKAVDPGALSSAEAHSLIGELLGDKGCRSRLAAPKRLPPPGFRPQGSRRPKKASSRQVDLLRRLASQCGKPIDEETIAGLDTTRASRMIEDLKQRGYGAPTKRQLEFARKLARRNGIPVPDDCLKSKAACSRFIEAFSCGRLSGWYD